MTTPREPYSNLSDPNPESGKPPGHGWMMIACCVPMLATAVVLVVTGVLGIGFLFGAVMCTVLMAAMMGAMGRGDHS